MGWKEGKMVLPQLHWEEIERPKEWGGWGINNMGYFFISLAAKLGWILMTEDNICTIVVKRKYIDLNPLEEWIRFPEKGYTKLCGNFLMGHLIIK